MTAQRLHGWRGWFERGAKQPVAPLEPAVRGALIWRAHAAIRTGDIDLAEAMVLEHGDRVKVDAACLNLLGLIAEARGRWTEAHSFWCRAAHVEPGYEPAAQNLRRYFELFQFGRAPGSVVFGDESDFDRLIARICRD
jgi:hypothetical protein